MYFIIWMWRCMWLDSQIALQHLNKEIFETNSILYKIPSSYFNFNSFLLLQLQHFHTTMNIKNIHNFEKKRQKYSNLMKYVVKRKKT
jgi:hypothetical protein